MRLSLHPSPSAYQPHGSIHPPSLPASSPHAAAILDEMGLVSAQYTARTRPPPNSFLPEHCRPLTRVMMNNSSTRFSKRRIGEDWRKKELLSPSLALVINVKRTAQVFDKLLQHNFFSFPLFEKCNWTMWEGLGIWYILIRDVCLFLFVFLNPIAHSIPFRVRAAGSGRALYKYRTIFPSCCSSPNPIQFQVFL